ncbi:RHTO0S04e02564g2_1 [Rhodotorula toruloides]|uniref:RHTO0S04e02564g2_1 n=1 Tax=Rhodotorula toruloides TaxID=5286 RepID=A0A061APU8_RHOTO|nr:RHTO0S04e02564g2_1 [Rhodotorula toruloides]
MLAVPKPTTLTFKTVLGVDYQLDVWLPEQDSLAKTPWEAAPVLCYYHGGGLCAGNRDWNAWVPDWLFCVLSSAFVRGSERPLSVRAWQTAPSKLASPSSPSTTPF